MERIRFFEHHGHRVLLIDMTECNAEDVATIADKVPPLVTKEVPGSVLLLADFTGARLSREALERIKVAAVFNRQHLKRSAWVLSSESALPLRDAVQTFSVREIPSFSTREEALQFLTSEAA
jgi:hypothetical protein